MYKVDCVTMQKPNTTTKTVNDSEYVTLPAADGLYAPKAGST